MLQVIHVDSKGISIMGESEEERVKFEKNCEKDYWEVRRCSQQQGMEEHRA